MSGTEVTFQSSFFKPVPGEEEETNPGIYGKALAEWLAEDMKKRGGPFEGIVAEDWGWLVMVQRKPFLLWVGCGNVQDGSADTWRIFLAAERSLFQRLLGREKVGAAAAITMLTAWLKDLVPTIPGVTNVTWE